MPTTIQIAWTTTRKSKDSASIQAVDLASATSLPTTPPIVNYLPFIGESVAIDGDSYVVTDIETTRPENRPAGKTYSISLSATASESGTGSETPRPWDAEPSLEVYSAGREVPVFKDKLNRPILNSAKQRPDIPLEAPTGDMTLVIKRNRQITKDTMMSRARGYNFRMNDASFTLFGQTFPAKTLLCRYAATLAYDKGDAYAQETITLEENSDTWVNAFLDEGKLMLGCDFGSGVVNRTRQYFLPQRGGSLGALEQNTDGTVKDITYPEAWTNTDAEKSHAKGAGKASILVKGAKPVFRNESFLLNGAGRPLVGVDRVTAGKAPVNQPSQDEAYSAANPENVPNVDTAKSTAEAVILKFELLGTCDLSALSLSGGF